MKGIEEAAEKFKLLDRIPIGICVFREDFVVMYWNRCLEKWTNIAKQKIIGSYITTYFPHLGQPKYASRLQQIFAGGPPTIFSSQFHKHLIPAYLLNGQLRVEHTTVTAEPAPDGGYYALLSIQDVTELTQRVQDYRTMRDRALAEVQERQQAEQQLKASLQEKEVLLKEIHHRVKNNLQVISSLLKLQSEYLKDGEVISLLNDSYNRVRSMALIHEKLYQSQGLAQIDAADYIRSLAYNLVSSYRQISERIDLDIQVDPIFFDVDTAIPCGLIINELLCNALKYAFPEQSMGKITINLAVLGNKFISLEIGDNGIGLPAEFNIDMSETLGLQLVSNLTNQLDGNIEIAVQCGTFFRITFPQRGNIYKVPSLV